jgi:endo-1,4-beta-D-glucanase Y
VFINPDGENRYSGRPLNSISISEGHGYGMMITTLIAGYDPQAKSYFDGLYKFFKDHPSRHDPNLMAWNQVKGCTNARHGGDETATDGDMDVAYALLLADKQWGSGGDIDYLQEATNVIDAIMEKEINRDTSLPLLADREEEWLQKALYKYGTRPSDFITDHMRAFQSATGDPGWSAVIDATYDLIDLIQTQSSPRTGLLPDFVQNTNTAPRPAKADYLESNTDGQYSYNACRVPWRIGTDYLTSGDSRALTALDKINTWIRSKTSDNAKKIVDGYTLKGKNTDTENAVAFLAPFGVGAMVSADNQEWLNDIWDLTVERALIAEDYFGNTLKMLTMITMSGNWWKP